MRQYHRRGLAGLLIAFALVFAAACEGDTGPAGPTGPQGPQGDEGPQGLAGEDGNANATLHIFDGHDFAAIPFVDLCLGEDISEEETVQSSWNVYLGIDDPDFGLTMFHVPGSTFGSEYAAVTAYDGEPLSCPAAQPLTGISLTDGTGGAFDEIRIIQVVANTVSDNRSWVLDMTEYHPVIDLLGDRLTVVRH